MINKRLEAVCDIATESHIRIQKDFTDINPMVGINQKMREMGLPVDALTIDCLKNGKRILIILHDHEPDTIKYQFSFKDEDPGDEFEEIQSSELTANRLYNWMKNYFRSSTDGDRT